MKMDKWLLAGIAACLVTLFAGAAWWYKRAEAIKVNENVQANLDILVRPYNPFSGPADAKVTVVEFLDPECESCRMLYPVAKEALQEFGSQVKLVIRYMPFHGNSFYAASAIEAARKQGKFYEALETLFAHQPEWGDHQAPKPNLILGYLEKLGLDSQQLKAAMADLEIQSRIKQDEEDGKRLGVNRTPTFFVNGRMLERVGNREIKDAVKAALGN